MRERSRVDTIYEVLRDRICLGEYARGDIFHEADLGQEFEVSRTPIRQVLQRLAFEKLAVVRTGVGTIVEGCSAEMARNYLDIHARLLASVAELGMAVDPLGLEETAASLHFRASRLEAKADAERFWLTLKDLQALSNRLICDDLVRHMDELLFYRSGPTIMLGARDDPQRAAAILKQNVADIVEPIEDDDYQAFFIAQSSNARRYMKLVQDVSGRLAV